MQHKITKFTEILIFQDGCEDSTLKENGCTPRDGLMIFLLIWNVLYTII
jgi:hypothetical protein